MKDLKVPNLVILAALTLITVVFWILFGIMRIISRPEEISVPAQVLQPLNPTLNTEVLRELESKIFLTDEEIGTTILTPKETPAPLGPQVLEITPTPESTISATPDTTPNPDSTTDETTPEQ